MSVPSVVWAPAEATLSCGTQETENETVVDIRWFKLVDNHWKLIKIFTQHQVAMRAPTSEMRAEEGEGEETPKEEPPAGEATEAPTDDKPPEEETSKPAEEATEAPTGDKPPEEETSKPAEEGDPPKETSEAPSEETTKAPVEENTPEPTKAITTAKPEALKKEPEYYTIEGMVKTEDSSIKLTRTYLSSAGLYKCVINSTREMKEKTQEMRVFYKPEEGLKPKLSEPTINDNHISIKCMAPAAYPMMTINFFINYESAPHEEVHRLPAIKIKNTTYGPTEELLMNVEELRFRATEHSVLNGKVLIACTAIFADMEHSVDRREFPFDGVLYRHKCLSVALIILIVVVVIIVMIIIVAIIWLILRKKKLNSLNKVAELFNKQKTITVLVDNNTNDLKIE